MQLSLKAMVIAGGILWGSAILLVGLINLADPNYGASFLQMTNSVYPWFRTTHTIRNVLIGTMEGAADGAVAALIFAWLYNAFASSQTPSRMPQN